MTTRIQPTQAAPLALVDASDGPRIDSETIARSMGNKHRPTLALIEKYREPLSDFGKVLFN